MGFRVQFKAAEGFKRLRVSSTSSMTTTNHEGPEEPYEMTDTPIQAIQTFMAMT